MQIVRMSELEWFLRKSFIKEVNFFLKDLIFEYPLHNIWYKKMINSMEKNSDREILLALENKNLLGTAILKNSDFEKKICTLKVSPCFQHKGIGKELLAKSLEVLETDKPILTVTYRKSLYFKKIFEFYGFSLESLYPGKYMPNSCELVYNGILMPETLIQNEQKLVLDELSNHFSTKTRKIIA